METTSRFDISVIHQGPSILLVPQVSIFPPPVIMRQEPKTQQEVLFTFQELAKNAKPGNTKLNHGGWGVHVFKSTHKTRDVLF